MAHLGNETGERVLLAAVVLLLLSRCSANFKPRADDGSRLLINMLPGSTTLGEQFKQHTFPYLSMAYFLPNPYFEFQFPPFPKGAKKVKSLDTASPGKAKEIWLPGVGEVVRFAEDFDELCPPSDSTKAPENATAVFKEHIWRGDRLSNPPPYNLRIEDLVDVFDKYREPNRTVCIFVKPCFVLNVVSNSENHEFQQKVIRNVGPTTQAWAYFTAANPRPFAWTDALYVHVRYDMYRCCNGNIEDPHSYGYCSPKFEGMLCVGPTYSGGRTRGTNPAAAAAAPKNTCFDGVHCLVEAKAFVQGIRDHAARLGNAAGRGGGAGDRGGGSVAPVVLSVPPMLPARVRDAIYADSRAARPFHSDTLGNWANFLNMEAAYRAKYFYADVATLWTHLPSQRRRLSRRPTIHFHGSSRTSIEIT